MLREEHTAAAAAIEDCRDTCDNVQEFEGLVGSLVEANAGMGVAEFARVVVL